MPWSEHGVRSESCTGDAAHRSPCRYAPRSQLGRRARLGRSLRTSPVAHRPFVPPLHSACPRPLVHSASVRARFPPRPSASPALDTDVRLHASPASSLDLSTDCVSSTPPAMPRAHFPSTPTTRTPTTTPPRSSSSRRPPCSCSAGAPGRPSTACACTAPPRLRPSLVVPLHDSTPAYLARLRVCAPPPRPSPRPRHAGRPRPRSS